MSIIQVIIVIGVVTYLVVKKLNKDAVAQQEQVSEYESDPDYDEDDIYEDVDEGTVSNTPSPFVPSSTATHVFGKNNKKTQSSKLRPERPPITIDEEQAAFDIRSVEEVKRAIIWSEILNRKY